MELTSTEDLSLFRRGTDGWGPWRLDTEVFVLFTDDPYHYEVDLESCVSSAEVLDWICQIAEKEWGRPDILAGLVQALNDVLRPQASLCSWGQSKSLTKVAIRRRVAELAKAVSR